MQQSYCQSLTIVFEEFKGIVQLLDKDIGQFPFYPENTKLLEIGKKIGQTEQERADFLDTYKNAARDLLSKWFYAQGSHKTTQKFLTSINFDSKQRAILKEDFSFNPLNYFPSLISTIDGLLDIRRGDVTNIDFLEEVTSDFTISSEVAISLKRLKRVGADLTGQPTCLDNLEKVKGKLELSGPIKQLPKLASVGEMATFEDTELKNIDSLETVGGLYLKDNPDLTSLKQLRKAGMILIVKTPIEALDKLEEAESVDIYDNRAFTSFARLQRVKKEFTVGISSLAHAELLETVGGNFLIFDSHSLEPFNGLTEVGGYVDIRETNIGKDLPFSKAFPLLRKVGKDQESGISICVDSDALAEEVKALQQQGKLEFDGKIQIGYDKMKNPDPQEEP